MSGDSVSPPLHLEALIDQVQARRRQLLVTGVGTLLLAAGTFVGPFIGSVVVSMTVSGSALTGGPLIDLPMSESELSTFVGLASVLVSGPLCLAMLYGSWVWHRFVREEAEAAGIEKPALGIAAPAKLVGWPLVLGLVLTAFLLPIPWLLPAPDSSDILGNALAGGALLAPLLGPLAGLLIGWRRGVDGQATQRFVAGELLAEDLADDPVTAFPMIARRPRSLVRAELLLDSGRLDEADALIQDYLSTVGVSLHRGLMLWAKVHHRAGRPDRAEQTLAAAARLVPVDVSAMRELAKLRAERGLPRDAKRLRDEADAVRASFFGAFSSREAEAA